MSALSHDQIEQFRQMLVDKRRELQEDMRRMQGGLDTQEEQSPSGGMLAVTPSPADVGTETYQRELDGGLVMRAQARLREIDAALKRIEEGTYGICQDTGQPIDLKRLQAKPWARYTREVAQKRGDEVL